MRIALISFTLKGGNTCKSIADKLSLRGEMCLAYGMKDTASDIGLIPMEKSLSKWTKEAFDNNDAIVFIGATGIAVRAVAPYLKSKDQDPAIVAVDERGQYVISLLSGHLGGANKLASRIAEDIDGIPVITTATDINKRFAVDVWAKSQNLSIVNLKAAKQISADILKGKTVYLYYGGRIEGEVPEGIQPVDAVTLKEKIHEGNACIIITEKVLNSLKGGDKTVLQLVPKNISVGMGCKKDISYKSVLELFEKAVSEAHIRTEAIQGIASIDLKKSEKALLKLGEKFDIPFRTFTGEELMNIEGDFTPSAFVRSITGLENVCERAAVASNEGSTLFLRKQSLNGVTIAMAKSDTALSFAEKDE
ncbi:cobalt-precorrin 5A hydrolase [Aminipila luticellarii]|uniref:Cobalamin biosynthesis protein CbiG n=1 Tax=Aminipila luticellarii TaxID=2507160 RepID=A0A410PVM3_9FIRM|nr:cobalt-precorrin 5A hydrolase [Aminipila luticellarii]QAT42916.1 cobalamin biosynthesis protein CbiG [Aminipila luticellarii]